jgi:hypothetical protein
VEGQKTGERFLWKERFDECQRFDKKELFVNMKKIIWILALSVAGCSNPEITMTYRMTACADPWMRIESYAADKEGTLLRFLQQQGIEPSNVTIQTVPLTVITCNSCACDGDQVATVVVPRRFRADMEKFKFKN